jgi:hypothetical protein
VPRAKEPTGGRRRRNRSAERLEALMETVGPPLSTTAWAAEFVAQTLEILPVFIRDGELFWLKPVHGDSLRIGLAPSSSPGDDVLAAMKWYPLTPVVVHSTSWRSEEGRVILTYVAVVEPPDQLPPDSLETLPVSRAELARGEAMAAPQAIGVGAVLEHALRHLAWLIRDDPAIAGALADWLAPLAVYVPEPFRAI